MSQKFKYDYCYIDIPRDLAPEGGSDPMRYLGDCAINEASERSKIFRTPAEWTAQVVEETDAVVSFRVRRRTNR